MNFEGSETIKIVSYTYGPDDISGNPTKTKTETVVKGVFVGWGGSKTEEQVNRDLLETEITFYLPYGTKIPSYARFLYNGIEWEKVGNAQEWQAPPSFQSWTPGVVVNAKRAEG